MEQQPDRQDKLREIENTLTYRFNNLDYLCLSLTHKSVSLVKNNQNLEFLGDTILQYIITKYLFDHHADKSEGELTILRASLVNSDTLVLIAKMIQLSKHLIINTKITSNILEDAFEALIGAIYIDSDLTTVSNIVLKLYEQKKLLPICDVGSFQNVVSVLYEMISQIESKKPAQARLAKPVVFQSVKKTNQEFYVTLIVLNKFTFNTHAPSIKQAKVILSHKAVKYLKQNKTLD